MTLDVEDAVETLRTITAHRDYVRKNLLVIQHDLERRSLEHDLSKLSPEEFPGFCRINRAARKHPYGSDEYKAGLTWQENLEKQRERYPEPWFTKEQWWLVEQVAWTIA